MKKDTKQKIMVAFIAVIFLFSSIAFVANSAMESQQTPIDLTKFVVDGELTEQAENEHLRLGHTIMKFYYSNDNMIGYVDSLPENFKKLDGSMQLVVEKIVNETSSVLIRGPYGEVEIENVTEEKIFEVLCNSMLYTPPECILVSNFKNRTNSS